jgi:hypothetical protein
MAKIITIESYDLVKSQSSGDRHINTDQIVELKDLISYDQKPLTRVILSNGDFVDTQKSVADLTKAING